MAGRSLKYPLTSLDFKEIGLSPATGLSLHLPHVSVSEALAQSKLCCQSFSVRVTEETATFYTKWPWSPETRDAERPVPACLGREAGTAVGPTGDGMGRGRLGSKHTDCRDSRLWACPGPLRSTGETG